MRRIVAVLVLLFVAGVFSLFLIAQSGTEEVSFPDVLDPTTVEVNFTPAVLPQLVVFENITEPYDDADAALALVVVQETIEGLQDNALPVFYAGDKFFEARKAYEGENVTGIVEELLQITDAKQRERTFAKLNLTVGSRKINFDYASAVKLSRDAVEHAQKLHTLQERVTLLNYTVAQVNRSAYNISELDIFLGAISAQLQNEQNIDLIGGMIVQAYARLDELLVEHSRAVVLLKASQRTLKNFILTNWKSLLILVFVAFIVGVISVNELRIYLFEEKINNLHLEFQTLEKLCRKVQNDRYVEKTLTKSDYGVRMQQYKSRMTAIQHTLPVVKGSADRLRHHRKYYFPIFH
ncbi:MAG: hypothetical protein HY363_00810 [Candidatus Aenigmarchaeota archaeon]|nr:hypothetical protein [Candidatus Aenigmarchaeota archaeon]